MVWTKDCCDSDPSCTILEPHDLGAGAGAGAEGAALLFSQDFFLKIKLGVTYVG